MTLPNHWKAQNNKKTSTENLLNEQSITEHHLETVGSGMEATQRLSYLNTKPTQREIYRAK